MTLVSNRDPVYLREYMDEEGVSPLNGLFSNSIQADMFKLLLNHRVFGDKIFVTRPLYALYNNRRRVIKTMKKCNKRRNFMPRDVFKIVCKYVMY
jgi:hypothetical protein